MFTAITERVTVLGNRKTIIIGGGAGGLMAGIFSAENGNDTIIVEKNKRPGRKLYITGKGRCNVCNNCDERTVIANTPTNGKFLYSALSNFSPSDTISFFEKHGCPLKTERGSRVFPVSDRAGDIVDTLVRAVNGSGCTIVNDEVTDIFIEDGRVKGIVLSDGNIMECDKLIIATGGRSYPLTGSTGDGYTFAKKAGHTIVPLRPSLVPLETAEHFGYDAEGLLLKNIAVRVIDTAKKNKCIYSDFGEMELHRYGLSGAVIRSASAHMKNMENGRYRVEIDLKPALNEETLDARLLREIGNASAGIYTDILSTLIPRALIEDFIKLSGIPADKRCAEITRTERKTIIDSLKKMTRNVTGFRPIEEAIVTSGGVSVKEIDPKTMGSKLIDGLYFAGEVIDIDCYTGGFNLQAAFSTGVLAGIS